MKMMEGAFSLAKENSWLTSFSDSPIHFETRSEEDMLKNVDSASVATACSPHNQRAQVACLLSSRYMLPGAH